LTANAEVSGYGTASAGLTGSAAGGLEKGEAMDMAWGNLFLDGVLPDHFFFEVLSHLFKYPGYTGAKQRSG